MLTYTSTEEFVWDYLREGDKVINVGANIGTVTLEAAVRVGNSEKEDIMVLLFFISYNYLQD